MKKICFIFCCLFAARANAQVNQRLAKTIDSLYEADQSVQLKLKAMYERNAPRDSLKMQDSLKKATYVNGISQSKKIYAQYGYPTEKLAGTDASHHFFVLIQHADNDPAFQVAMLPVLDQLSKEGNILRKDYAYLYDRVQHNTKGKQLYGTQPTYDKKGNLFDSNNKIIYPPDLADPENVDQRRKEVGLGTIEEYYASILEMLGRPRLSDNPLKTKLDSAVHQAAVKYLKDSTAHGIVIGITDHGRKHFYHYGESNGLYYNIGSVAKTFVGTMLAQAIVEKRAALQDDVRKYLPGHYANLQYKGVPIRLVDLANHTSGLPGTFHHYSESAMNGLKGKSLTEQAAFFATYRADSLLLDLHNFAPDTIPGTKFRYNSSAYMLLTLVLERIYKKPYQEIVTGYLQKHLGMSKTKPLLTAAELQQAAQGHDRNNKPVPYINLEGYFIGPSLNSTLSDMVNYLEAQLAEKDAAINLTHQRTFGKPDGFSLGLSWMMNTENGQIYIYHDGNTKIGFNTLCTIYPKDKLGIVIIVNDVASQDKVGKMENAIMLKVPYK
jgi:CubicO group peptidase (beta-lactamase class C family)